jgi:ATP-dependent helicase/nuclease subunit B
VFDPTHIVGFGRPASEALAGVIGAARTDDPLRPVTVVVPSNFVGLSIRRLLGSGTLSAGERAGLANVSFVTPFQLAEQVASDLLLDTRPITNPVLGAAVRRALADDPGPYAPVAQHEATEAALAGLFAELSNVDEAGLEAIDEEGSEAASLAVAFYRSIAQHLRGFHTERDLATAAAERDDLAQQLERFGHVVWYLPAPTTSALGHFLNRVLSDAVDSSVIVGVTGHENADRAMWRTCSEGGVHQPASTRQASTEPVSPTADHIVSVTDAAEEVRDVCSRVLSLVSGGVALDRIGVFFPTPDPYVRIIEQQFGAAGIAVNGPDQRRLADSVAGRTLLNALSLPHDRWRRDRVMALLSAGPIRSGDERVRPAAWDVVSREAGVVGDLRDWRAKLEHHRETTQKRHDEIDPAADADGWRRQRQLDVLTDIANLQGFIDWLHSLTSAVTGAPGWPDRCRAAAELLRGLLGAEHQHSRWPDAEQEAFARVEAALVRLATLEAIEPDPTTDVFVRALTSELDVARGRRGRFGTGVMYGPIAAAVGHDFDAVFVVGAAEGMLPVPRRDDAILPEAVRTNSLDQLESKSARLHHQHRAFLAALASAPKGGRTIMFPRGSLRSSRRTLPSRWLLDTASALASETVHATDFEHLDSSVVETVPSFATGIRTTPMFTSVEERDLAVLGNDTAMGVAPVVHPLADLVGAGLKMQVERASSRFSVYDGNLSAVDTSLGNRPVSPSRLETWAACGYRYFLKHVLDVSDRDDPERTDEISALDRGSLIHQTLEEFVAEAIDHGAPAPDMTWTPEQRARLHEIADDLAQIYEATGKTGRAINWRVRRDDLRSLLDTFIEVDERFRRSHLATPDRVELDFGVRSGDPVDIELPSGRRLAMRGLADRIDLTQDGRVVVSDYKSGKGKKFDSLDEDPFVAGTGLQLGMYSEGALQHSGRTSATAAYWLVEADGKERRGYAWTDALRARFHEVLSVIVDGIDGGVFIAAPGEWNTFRQTNESCSYCEFDSLCLRDRGEQSEAKSSDAAVQIRERLVPASDGDEGSS